MTNRKTTKKALLGSLLALVLCFSMLVGTTFAWFTDSEFINGNKIQAGTLDIELGSENPLFSFDENDNWEPGFTRTASTVLENKGTLTLKYKFSIINVVEVDGGYDNKTQEYGKADGSRLADVLEVYFGKEIAADESNFLGTLSDLIDVEYFNIDPTANNEEYILYPAGSQAGPSAAAIDFVIKMKEEAGNEYMADSVKFDIAIVATQENFEEDSFGPNYDIDAVYPAITPVVADANMTIEDVKIDADDYGADDAIVVNKGATVTINSGYFNGGTTEAGGAGNTAVFANGGNVDIYGGYFTVNGLPEGDPGHIDLIYAKDNARVHIYDGVFEGADETVWLVNCKDNSGARIYIHGGTFINWNPATELVAPADTTEITIYGKYETIEKDNGDVWYVFGK